VSKYISDFLEDLEESYYNSEKPQFNTARDYDEHTGGALDYYKEITAKRLGMGDYGPVEGKVADLLEKNGIDPIDKETVPYIKLCREMYRADIGLLEVEKRHLKGDFSYQNELPDIFPDFLEKPAERDSQTARLSEVIRHYVAENEKSNWDEKSRQEIESSLNLFMKVMGDVSIKSISRRQVSKFRDTLQKLPPNMNKVKKYRDKSIQQILEMDIDKTLSSRTINKIMGRVVTLFNHALKHEFIKGQNPATDMKLPLGKWEDDNRAPFTNHDLEKLMLSNEYINDKHGKSYQFWTPIIALFTGMRQNEIAQLHLDDIKCDEDGIWIIDVNAKGKKKVKTKAGIRKVPIHPFIVNELKLPEYVEKLKGRGEKRLFPELKKSRDGYAKSVSQWFNLRYKVRCGIKEDSDGRMKDFHSFRTTIINHLQRKKVPFDMLKQLVGHSKGKDVTQVFYTDRYTPKELLEDIVSKVDYGIDLSHLKNSRFVPR
jgi:integrase